MNENWTKEEIEQARKELLENSGCFKILAALLFILAFWVVFGIFFL